MWHLCIAAGFLGVATAGFAGCSDYDDGSLPGVAAPTYRICYDNVCDDTTLSYECANADEALQGFANGWATRTTVGANGTPQLAVTWQGRPIDPP